ncbi:MAG: BMC domain-containing protein [Defluviitaleaceae bacterium]|nr:BMC domain-containing protein [Defluviitaleaceae bacterium]
MNAEKLTLAKTPEREALAMIELHSVAYGITALDVITKTAEVDILAAQIICPGKYMIIFSGSLSAINASLEAARHISGVLDEFILGSPHPDIFPAIKGDALLPKKTSLGLIETYSGASAIKAADTAAKTAWITLAKVRISHGMCGKSVVIFTGELAAVAAALETAKKEAAEKGQLLDTALIPNPDDKMINAMQ